MKKVLWLIWLFPMLLLTGFKAMPHQEGDCPNYQYEIFYKFNKILNDKKYRCYGNPSSAYEAYYCPMQPYGRCEGTYFKQQFCNNGNTYYLYYTEKKCTCGCVGKNFHGKSLNILDTAPCACDDTQEEVIGKDNF